MAIGYNTTRKLSSPLKSLFWGVCPTTITYLKVTVPFTGGFRNSKESVIIAIKSTQCTADWGYLRSR
ncbi:hypothetical protein OK016_00285 [Vibrio chagasii]|nr:hypothetical protein [Vibrio chagasii]